MATINDLTNKLIDDIKSHTGESMKFSRPIPKDEYLLMLIVKHMEIYQAEYTENILKEYLEELE